MGVRVTPGCDSINTVVVCNAPQIQQMPDVAFGDSLYLAVWSDGRAGLIYRIFAGRVTPAGGILDPAGFQVGPNNNLYHFYPSVAYNGSRFLVVWAYGTTPYDIMGCFVNPDGTLGDTVSILKPGMPVYTTRLAFDGTNFLIAWVEWTGSTYDLKAELISGATAAPLGPSFTIASNVYYDNSVGLSYDPPWYMVTYSTLRGSLNQVCGRAYDTAGQPVGTQFQISNSAYSCYQCDVAPGTGGHFLNLWSEARSNWDIYGNADIQSPIAERDDRPAGRYHAGSTILSTTAGWRYADHGRAVVYTTDGRKIGEGMDGVFDCSRLRPGVYFLVTENGETARAVIIGR